MTDQDRALAAARSGDNLFITGKAGTGKSTLLREMRKEFGMMVCSPTGMAALNVGGATIHSVFQINPFCVDPDEMDNYKGKNAEAIRKAEMIVIDEISMVRADLLNLLNHRLQELMNSTDAFGGKQMVFFGDMLQLPPVVKDKKLKEYLQDEYGGPYFFQHPAIKECGMKLVELTKVYRQTDQTFIDVLNAIREGRDLAWAVGKINERIVENYDREAVVLATTNKAVDDINNWHMAMLEGVEEVFYDASIAGNFPESMYPTETRIRIKAGARVMILKNNQLAGYVNGQLGEVMTAGEGGAAVLLDGRKESSRISFDSWENYKYVMTQLEGGKRKMGMEPVGTFTQMPLRLAWAQTIHKCVARGTLIPSSQGLVRIEGLVGDVKVGVPTKVESVASVLTREGTAAVTEVFNGGLEPALRITTKRGYTLTTSRRHPLLVCKGVTDTWVKAPELKVGDCMVMRTGGFDGPDVATDGFVRPELTGSGQKRYLVPSTVGPELAWLLGAVLGDGCVSSKRDGRVDLTNEDDRLLKRAMKAASDIFGISPTLDKKRKRMYWHGVGVRMFLEWAGVPYVTARSKFTPWAILQGSDATRGSFLQGLFDTDGGVNHVGVHFTTTSEQLAEEVQIILTSLDVVCSRHSMSKGTAWRVTVCGRDVVRFKTQVGFSIKAKQQALDKAISRTLRLNLPKANLGFFPDSKEAGKELIKTLQPYYGVKYGNTKRLYLGSKHWQKYISRVARGVSGLTYEHLRCLKTELGVVGDDAGQLFYRASLGYFLDQIETIEATEAEMFDIGVSGHESFISNGFVSHNSQGATFDKVHIDIGRGAFTSGQTYVALSRCRTLEGMTLARPISVDDVMVDPLVLTYPNYFGEV